MKLRQFFSKVLPEEGRGHHILVCKIPSPGGEVDRHGKARFFWRTKAFTDFRDMAIQAKQWDREGYDVYHACSSFKQINTEVRTAKKSGRPYRAIVDTRTQDNAAFTRAQWLDVDVGPGKDYETREEALTALTAVVGVLGIPSPMVVGSGKSGLHCYWPFTADLPAETAALLMGSFLLALEDTDFRHDTSRTADTASVLRPLGTHNHKTKKPHVVELLQDAEPIEAKKFYRPFRKYIEKAKLLRTSDAATEAEMFDELNAAIRAGSKPATDWLRVGNEDTWEVGRDILYAPYSIKRAAGECGVLRSFFKHKKTQEPIPEPVWRGLIGLCESSVEGRKAAHTLSKRSDSRYDYDNTEYYLDRWTYGPTKCAYFQREGCKECETCPHADKISSPKTLGEEPVNEEALHEAAAEASTDEQVDPIKNIETYACVHPDESTLPFWAEEKYLAHRGHGTLKRHATDEELKANKPDWIEFSRTIYYPYFRYYDWAEQKYVVKVCAQTGTARDSKAWRIFEMDAAVTNDANQLAKALAAQGVNYMGGKNKSTNLQYVQDVLQGLKSAGLETNSYTSFGWHDDGFVLGDTYLDGKAERPVFISKELPEALQGHYGLAGTLEGWVNQVDKVYNRPGAEPYQFMILSSFASPLVSLSNPGGLWHGLVNALTGDGGIGKTSTCKVAASVWGNPTTATIQANEEGTTLNALVQRIGTMRHLPLIMDEITGRKLEEIQSILYSVTSGKPKSRCEQNGSERNTNLEWAMIPFVTGNLNITTMLAQAEAAKQTATQVRCFEIRLPANFNKTVFGDLDAKHEIEHELLGKQYGHAGRKYIQYVIRNREKVEAALLKARSSLAKKYGQVDSAERFYYDLVANVMVAGQIAAKLGLIKFDVKAVRDWALAHIERLRADRKDTQRTLGDWLQAMLSDMHRRTVVTQYWNEGRAKHTEDPFDSQYIQNPCARRAIKSERYLIKKSAVIEWCNQNKLDYNDFIDSLRKDGIIIDRPGSDKASIFSGLTDNLGLGGSETQPRCWEFRYSAVAESVAVRPQVGKIANIHRI